MESTLELADVGLFVAGYGIGSGMVAAFESILATYFQPVFYKKVSVGNKVEQGKAWVDYARIVLPSLFLIVFFVTALAPELTKLLLASEYQTSVKFVVWGAIAELARLSTSVYAMVAHARMKTRLLIAPNVIGGFVLVVAIIYLLPLYKATGVGLALSLAGVATFVSMYFATRNELPTVLPYKILTQCLLVGIFSIIITNVARWFWLEGSVLFTVSLLTLLAVIFLPIQYLILKPYLNEKLKFSGNAL